MSVKYNPAGFCCRTCYDQALSENCEPSKTFLTSTNASWVGRRKNPFLLSDDISISCSPKNQKIEIEKPDLLANRQNLSEDISQSLCASDTQFRLFTAESVSERRWSRELRRNSNPATQRHRTKSNVSFDELMQKIKLYDTTGDDKAISRYKNDAAKSASAQIENARYPSGRVENETARTSIRSSQDNIVLSSAATRGAHRAALCRAEDTLLAGSSSMNHDTIDARTQLVVENPPDNLTIVSNPRAETSEFRAVPSSSTIFRMHRRQSTPLHWRVPSTKYEIEEDVDLESVPKSRQMDHVVASSQFPAGLKKHYSNTNEPRKSQSSTHLPGLFARRPGQSLQIASGGSHMCPGCANQVYSLEETAGPAGTWWHRNCLRCKMCRKVMDSSSKHTKNDYRAHNTTTLVFCRLCWSKQQT